MLAPDLALYEPDAAAETPEQRYKRRLRQRRCLGCGSPDRVPRALMCARCRAVSKHCSTCYRVKPLADFAQRHHGSLCRACERVYRRRRDAERAPVDPAERARQAAAFHAAGRAATLAKGVASRAAVVAAVRELGGPPGITGKAFWPRVAERVGRNAESCRNLWFQAVRKGEVNT